MGFGCGLIGDIDAQLSAAPQWSLMDHQPPDDSVMGGWERWSYEWEHEGATIGMELSPRERAEGNPRLSVEVESECYHVDATGVRRLGPDELE